MLNPDFRDMLAAFIAEDVEFLVVGAYALAVHGVALPEAWQTRLLADLEDLENAVGA
jgi:hypothetical protein